MRKSHFPILIYAGVEITVTLILVTGFWQDIKPGFSAWQTSGREPAAPVGQKDVYVFIENPFAKGLF
jgi:hypothetical protein